MSQRRCPTPGQNAAVTARDPSSRELRCRAPNGAHHTIVDTAPTEMVRECVLDLVVVWIAIAVQKALRGHDDSVRAITALCGLLGEESPLQGVRIFYRTQSLQRGHLIAPDVPKRCRAGPDQIAADYRGASSTLTESAPKFWPVQSEVVTQNIEQGRIRGGVDYAGFAVDYDASGHLPSMPVCILSDQSQSNLSSAKLFLDRFGLLDSAASGGFNDLYVFAVNSIRKDRIVDARSLGRSCFGRSR